MLHTPVCHQEQGVCQRVTKYPRDILERPTAQWQVTLEDAGEEGKANRGAPLLQTKSQPASPLAGPAAIACAGTVSHSLAQRGGSAVSRL